MLSLADTGASEPGVSEPLTVTFGAPLVRGAGLALLMLILGFSVLYSVNPILREKSCS